MTEQNKKQLNNDPMENEIMSQITTGKVKLRSKYLFLVEKLGLSSAFAIDLLLAIIFFNLIIFYFRASDNIACLSLGDKGLLSFWESFPFWLISGLVLLILLGIILAKQSDMSYRKPFGYIFMGLIFFIMILGAILALTDIAERLEQWSLTQSPTSRILKPLIHNNVGDRNHCVSGRVIKVGDGFIMVQTPRNTLKLDLKRLPQPIRTQMDQGFYIIATGERNDNTFETYNLRITTENEMPMIRRGVIWQFGQLQP